MYICIKGKKDNQNLEVAKWCSRLDNSCKGKYGGAESDIQCRMGKMPLMMTGMALTAKVIVSKAIHKMMRRHW